MQIYIRGPNDDSFFPLGSTKDEYDLDPLTEHHYKSIAENTFVKEGNNLSTVYSATFEMSLGETPVYVMLPTVYDGKIMPTDTPEDIEKLFKRIEKDKSIYSFPIYVSERAALLAYRKIKETWKDIGSNSDKANEILTDSYMGKINGVTINLSELAQPHQEEKAINDFEKAKEQSLRKIEREGDSISKAKRNWFINFYSGNNFRGPPPTNAFPSDSPLISLDGNN